MITRVIIFTIIFLIVWVATINVFRITCNKLMMNNRELTLRIKVNDYIKYDKYNVIITEVAERSYEIRDLNKAFVDEILEKIGSYVTVTICITYTGCILLEPVLVIKEIKSLY